VAPPERPTAPKPVLQQQLPAAAYQLPQDAVLGMPGSLGQPSAMGMPQMPSAEAPKLKDFLPFMKPGSFGPKAPAGSHLSTVSNDCAPGSAGSLPASVSASPVHLPQAPVSFPPSPQRQPPPVSLPTSNGYGEMPWTAGAGYVHSDMGYPVAEVLLSPTAPPGAPRSASPAHQQPPTVAHPGGPAESQQQQQPFRPTDISYNIPQNYNQPSFSQSSAAAGIGFRPVPGITGSHAGAARQNGHPSNSQGDVQVIAQPPAVSSPVYSGHNLSQPVTGTSGVHTQQAFPSNMSSFPNQVPTQPSLVSNAGTVPPGSGSGTHPQHSGLPHGNVATVGMPVVSTSGSQSYPGGNVAASNMQQPSMSAATPGVPVHQFNNSNNVPGQFPSVGGTPLSNIEVSKPYCYQTPAAVPPPSTAAQFPYQSTSGQVRPPSYEVVTQHYPQLIHQSSSQPGFNGPLSSVQPAGVTPPMQTSYPTANTVRPEMPYGSVHAGNLAAGSQQSLTGVYPQRPVVSQPQQPPAGHQVMSAQLPQRPVVPVSAAFIEQQPQHISQDQPRYPVASQTVPGLPVPSQHFPDASHVPSQTPSHAQYPANVHIPAAQAQPRYPAVPSTSHPYPAAVRPAYQNTSQPPTANQMQPVHAAAGNLQPAVPSQQQYHPHPVHPNPPEVGHAAGYPPGSSSQMRYQAANQPASAYRQPPPVIPQHQLQYPSSTAQQQPLYHPGSSQPPVINQSATVSCNFSTAQMPYSTQRQPHDTAYSHTVNSAAGEMQALVEIPVCLPSPLQPSRVTAAEVSKNVDSLRDLDLSGKTTSSAGDVQPRQKDSSSKDAADSKTEAADASSVKVDEPCEKSEEELRQSVRQTHASRDVYADSDTMTRFVAEVEKFQKHVDSLLKPTLGGYFPLDKEWKVSFLLCVYS